MKHILHFSLPCRTTTVNILEFINQVLSSLQLPSSTTNIFILLDNWLPWVEVLATQLQHNSIPHNLSNPDNNTPGILAITAIICKMYNTLSPLASSIPKSSETTYPIDFTVIPLTPINKANVITQLFSKTYPEKLLTDYQDFDIPDSESISTYIDFTELQFTSYMTNTDKDNDNVLMNTFQEVSKDIFLAKLKQHQTKRVQYPNITLCEYISPDIDIKAYKNTVIGGTFDHLHEGHKILLSSCALLTTNKIVIGLSSGVLLAKKKYLDHLQSYILRRARVEWFLSLCNPIILQQIIPLYDHFGPSGDQADLQALFVSEETRSGGALVNAKRKDNQLDNLDIIVIPLALEITENSHTEVHINESLPVKLSSTQRREIIAKLQK